MRDNHTLQPVQQEEKQAGLGCSEGSEVKSARGAPLLSAASPQTEARSKSNGQTKLQPAIPEQPQMALSLGLVDVPAPETTPAQSLEQKQKAPEQKRRTNGVRDETGTALVRSEQKATYSEDDLANYAEDCGILGLDPYERRNYTAKSKRLLIRMIFLSFISRLINGKNF